MSSDRDAADERDRRDPPRRPGRSAWMDDEDDRPRKRAGLPVWAWVLIGVGGLAWSSG